jgi:alpha-amylase
MFFFNTILTFFLYFSSLVSAADTSAWKSRSIYFVLTDRIARSSSDTGGSSCGDLGNYCGGTFKGLESKLDYIKGLGFDAIWITPVVASGYSFRKNWTMANKWKDSAGGYHGYWAQDLYSINSNYGTAADLKSLVSTAHTKVCTCSLGPTSLLHSPIVGHLCHDRCCRKSHGIRCDRR